jgi:hypothetical protein
MWMNFDQLLDLPNVTVVNYKKIDDTIFPKPNLLHQILDTINRNRTEYSVSQYHEVRSLKLFVPCSLFPKTRNFVPHHYENRYII